VNTNFAKAPAPWIAALRRSHDRLRRLVDPLDVEQLQQGSYDSDWSIAQVLSHLGSSAEIFSRFLDAGLSGDEPPGREAFVPIWEAWSARSPQAQAADALEADEALVEQFESLDAAQQWRFRLALFGMLVDTTGLARMRLGEHAIHSWDVAVALDPATTLAPDAVDLLVDTLDQLVPRVGRPDGKARRVRVSTSDPERQFGLEVGEAVTLRAWDGEEGVPEVRLPAEAFLRLVYGRLDSAHTPPLETRAVDLDELRAIFPGF
jgi:uncharacterized protein (TIGR03083 family)